MRVILIEEERFAEICDLLTAKAKELEEETGTAVRLGVSDTAWRAVVDLTHRRFHYYFVQWAQSHGASCIHR